MITGGSVLACGTVLILLWCGFGRAVLAAFQQTAPLAEVLALAGVAAAAPERRAPSRAPLPPLSVIVTARDEAGSIEQTVRRLLAQRYPDLEIIVVDDRSTDGTSEILDRLRESPEAHGDRLQVVHLRELPEGWLGKCRACQEGAQRARGEWILFSDGDVTLASDDLLARAVAHALRTGLDHLAALPDTRPMSILQTALVAVFGQVFLLAARAYEMDRDLPRGGAGVGAFNLVRRRAYERIGGHRALRLDPLDDYKLGLLLKESGARQRLYDGIGLVLCPWLKGTLNVVRGLEKNFFPSFDYSLARVTLFTLASLLFAFGPLASGVATTAMVSRAGAEGSPTQPTAGQPGAATSWDRGLTLAAGWLPFAVQAGVLSLAYVRRGRAYGIHPLSVALYPVAVLLLLLAAWNSALRILARGGVSWRDTFYPLAALRAGIVHPGDGRRRTDPHAPRSAV